MALETYRKKRNFKRTPEPAGRISNQFKHLFVVQKHAASHLHYDFRLELNGVLLSWAIPKGPCLDPSVKRLAMHVEDHPVEYGGFEGIIPAGEYGGGTVMLWDKGIWIPEDENPTAAYHQGHLRFSLKAIKLQGRFSLIQFKDDNKSWFLVKAQDEHARALSKYDVTKAEPLSVISQQSLEEIAANYENVWTKKGLQKNNKQIKSKKLKLFPVDLVLKAAPIPDMIMPQLATLVDRAPQGNEWLHELKFDGYRILAFKQNTDVTLMSRNQRDWTQQFPNVVKEIKKLPVKNLILDGEVVLLDESARSNFQLLQNSVGSHGKHDFIYYVFDLLYCDKYDLTILPLIERKIILKNIIEALNDNTLRYSDHIVGDGDDVFKHACEMGLEGIVSKLATSQYVEKRSKLWLKVKCVQRQEFVIGGFTPPQGARKYFGSLYLGYYDKGMFKYSGNVGTGFNQASLKEIYTALKKIVTKKNPFTINPPGVTTAIWVKPILIAEVEFSEWTQEGILRHPSFKGIRDDKPAKAITREPTMKTAELKESKKKVLKSSIKITNPNKIIYPEDNITKRDLANYYSDIAEWILPFLTYRPLTLVRCPDDYKVCFYQKHIYKGTPKALHGIPIKEKSKIEECIYIKDFEGLLALVQMRTLEIHPWGSRIENVELPDMITFDLDPSPEMAWKEVVATAKLVRKLLSDYQLESFVKTTGGKGLHVVVPIKPEYDWKQVKNFTHVFVQYLVTTYPNNYIGEMSKQKRKGKIFVDYLRNQRGATAISAYSTRARLGAPVAVPLAWDELTDDFEDTFYTIENLPGRLKALKKNPWADFFKLTQSLRLDDLI